MKRAVLVSPLLLLHVSAQIYQATLTPRTSCIGSSDLIAPASSQLNFDTVYAQLDQGQTAPGGKGDGISYSSVPALRDANGVLINGTGSVLRIVLTGTTAAQSLGYSNITNFLSTLVINSQILTFTISSNQTALCSAIRTSSGSGGAMSSGAVTVAASGCPYGPGEIALGVSIPLAGSYPLTTITTQLRVLDPSVPPNVLACLDLAFSPYYPTYYPYSIFHYFPIGILATYLLIYIIARAWASHTDFVHEHESQLAASLTLKLSSSNTGVSKRRRWGAVWFGSWAGRQVVGSGSLRRFVTAEVRELWQAAVWWTLVGTVAVNWPEFSYPIFARSAWTALIYNGTSLPFAHPALPLLPSSFTAPPTFATQLSNRDSPLFLDTTLPNVLINLSPSAIGIGKWAQAVGVRHTDLWSICTFTFVVICAIVVAAQLLFAIFDTALDLASPSRSSKSRLRLLGKGKADQVPPTDTGSNLNRFSRMSHTLSLGGLNGEWAEEEEEEEVSERTRPEDDFPSWQLHLALLQGNLTRVLLIFHLPLTLFSVYQLSLHATSPISTLVMAALVLVLICFAIPALLLWRIHHTPIGTLFTSLPVLLSIGPLYNTYSDECTMFSGVRFVGNLALGIVIGAVQGTGTAQAAVILLVEVADTLVTSLWLPWADNSSMGPLAFILSISRIIIGVLLVVLSPAVAVSDQAASWLAYVVFLMQGLVIVLLLVGLLFKIVELLVRVIGKVPFDESRSPRVGGLMGAMRRVDRGGRSRGSPSQSSKKAAARRKKEQLSSGYNNRRNSVGDSSTIGTRTRMLPVQQGSGAQSRASSSMSTSHYADSRYAKGQFSPGPSRLGFGEDDEFIMSAMSHGPWASENSGYVAPGAYSGVSPTGRLNIGQDKSPASSVSSTGFARVGGGKSSSSNPYQMNSSSSRAYPPYPVSSADLYTSASSSGLPAAQPQPHAPVKPTQLANPRRLSQSAIIEMATIQPNSPPTDREPIDSVNSTSPNRTPKASTILPSSSTLLSNNVSQFPVERPSTSQSTVEAPTGFFGRFKRKGRKSQLDSDMSSDDDSDTEEDARTNTRKWPALFGSRGKAKSGIKEESAEDLASPIEESAKGTFSVTRKPRPKGNPAVRVSGTAGGEK